MHIHYVQHVAYEGIAGIGDWARARGHAVTGTHLYEGAFEHPGDFDMLVVMGGPMNIYEYAEYPWLAEEKRFIAGAVEAGKPVLGVCLGAQLVADVLGASVTRGPQQEIGWYAVELTDEAGAIPAVATLPAILTPLHWHGDTFAIPPGAVRLAYSVACENQAFAYDGGRVLGLQFHLEATPASWAALSDACADELEGGGEWVSSAEQMLAQEASFATIHGQLFELLDAFTRQVGVESL